MSLYAIRIDLTQTVSTEQIADWLCDIGTGYLCVREGGTENPHVHIVLYWERPVLALRRSFLRTFPTCAGNTAYSITAVKDEDKYHRYICKGAGEGSPPTIVCSNGLLYTDEWVEQMHKRYYEEAPVPKSKKRLIDAVFDTCKEAAFDWTDRLAISKAYIKECKSRKVSINLFQAKGAVNLIQCLICPTEAAELDLAAQI